MDDYGIERGDYRSLALRLAIEHAVGFPRFKLEHGTYGKIMPDKGGRPTVWTTEKLGQLVADVDRAKKEHGFVTDHDALMHLASKRGQWSPPSRQDEQIC